MAPLILEDPRAPGAWGTDLWLAEVDLEDGGSSNSKWVTECKDVVYMVSSAEKEMLTESDERRLQQHLDAGRRLLLVLNWRGQGPPPFSLEEADASLRRRLEDDKDLYGVYIVSTLRPRNPAADGQGEVVPAEGLPSAPASPPGSAWKQCTAGLRAFAGEAAERRLSGAASHLLYARKSFVQWCSQGAKVASAASSQFHQDAEDVRLARDLITRNIDDAYLAHVFSSVLVGKFATLTAQLTEAPAPDLGGQWGRHATRQVMEKHLSEKLEQGLRLAMRESLEEVTAEMAKQEQPSVQVIQRVAKRGANLPWDAEVRRLEVELEPDKLQDFAMHFFGSVSVGVLSGLGAAALEALLGELALGPVGVILGVATFVAIGVQNADWPSVRDEFVRRVRSRHLELVEKARAQLDFPGLCERRKRRILESMDLILSRLLAEVAALSEASCELARCALVLQQREVKSTESKLQT